MFFPPFSESGEEDNTSQSTLSSVNLYPAQTSPPPQKPSSLSQTAPRDDKEQRTEDDKEGVSDSAVKTDTSLKRTSSKSKRDSEDGVVSPSRKRDGSERRSKRQIEKREMEEGEESGSVDSESDSDSGDDKRESRSRSDMSRLRTRERRPRSPINHPPEDSQTKIPTPCRHFLNGELLCKLANVCFVHNIWFLVSVALFVQTRYDKS